MNNLALNDFGGINMIKKIMALVFIQIIFISLNSFSFGQDDVAQSIKIGLRSGSSAVASTSLASEKGLIFGYYSEGWIPLFELNNKMIYVRKDSYYLNMNGYFFEYDYDNNKDSHNSDIMGPIHIQLGGSYASKSEALKFANYVKTLGIEPYLALEGKWKVWVGTFTTYDRAEEYFDELKSILKNVDMTVISKNISRVQVTDDTGEIIFIYSPSYGDYRFEPKDDALMNMDNKLFRGGIILKNASNGNLTVINQLEIDEYLYGVLPKEMSATAPEEALKAQAVAARNYAVVNLNKHIDEGFDLCASTHCQTYSGFSAEKGSTNNAVDNTIGLILTHNGNPISTFYHMDSGGHTEDSENIWGGAYGYIKGVEDNFGEPYKWELTLSKKNIADALNSWGYSVGEIKDVYEGQRSQFDSVLKLVIKGSEGTVTLEKDNIRKVLGYNTIKSLKFQILKDNVIILQGKNTDRRSALSGNYAINGTNNIFMLQNNQSYIFNGTENNLIEKDSISNSDTYVFAGSGYGHALGMSQKGAIAMANLGYSYDEILYHYYTDVELVENE